MKRFCPPKNTPDKDIVMTPPSVALDIIKHFNPTGILLDPSKGEGAFYNNFNTTTKDWCEVSEGRDFLDYSGQVDWVITNPPWSKMQIFLEKAMQVSKNIVFLTTINHYTTKKRIRDMRSYGFSIKEIYCIETPPKPWPQLGFQLAAVHTQKDYLGDIKLSYAFPNPSSIKQ